MASEVMTGHRESDERWPCSNLGNASNATLCEYAAYFCIARALSSPGIFSMAYRNDVRGMTDLLLMT